MFSNSAYDEQNYESKERHDAQHVLLLSTTLSSNATAKRAICKSGAKYSQFSSFSYVDTSHVVLHELA